MSAPRSTALCTVPAGDLARMVAAASADDLSVSYDADLYALAIGDQMVIAQPLSRKSVDVFADRAKLLAALADVPADTVITVGYQGDRLKLDGLPDALPVSAPPPAWRPAPALTPADASRVIAQRCLLNGAPWLRLTLAAANSPTVTNGGLRWQAHGVINAAFPLPEALVIGIDLHDGIPARTLVFQPLTLAQLSAYISLEGS
jgi:hypothetical protein